MRKMILPAVLGLCVAIAAQVQLKEHADIGAVGTTSACPIRLIGFESRDEIPKADTSDLKQTVVGVPVQEAASPPLDASRTQGCLPRSPAQSLATLRTKPGLVVDLVAAEPLVIDPVAFDWGPDGKLWVVEMGDYPTGIDGKPGGRVRFLEDTNGDGKYDRSTLFQEGLNYPTGILVWRKGVLVTAAPEVLYLEDTNGDGKADRQEALFTGFGTDNPQHLVNGLRRGLDNWIHLANGDSGGVVRSTRTKVQQDIHGQDLSIQPDQGNLRTLSGFSQFGRSRDDWGNWFGCSNSALVRHFPQTGHFLQRNLYVKPPRPTLDVLTRPDPGKLYPISDQVLFKLSGVPGHVTAACGIGVYRDDLLGSEFTGNTFTCEPVNNLVHRRVLSPNGVTFTARRAEEEATSEFLASTDRWFRPAQARTGPDGALWVADMYRYVIEHPEWLPPETIAELDLRAGADMGRIYRIYPRDRVPRPFPRLDKMDLAELVAALNSPSGWQRDMAQQLLVWRCDLAAVDPLVGLVSNGHRPEARLHALCTLQGLNQLQPQVIVGALQDKHAGVRRHAVRLAETLLGTSPELGEAILQRQDDPDPQVQLQLAYALGAWKEPRAANVLATLAIKHHNKPYLLAAVFSSLRGDNVAAVLNAVLKSDQVKPLPVQFVEQLLPQVAALADDAAVGRLLGDLSLPKNGGYQMKQYLRLSTVLDTLAGKGRSLDTILDTATRKLLWPAVASARETAADAEASDKQRAAALRLFARASFATQDDLALVDSLLAPQNSLQLQASVVEVLARQSGLNVPARLLADWKSHGPALRKQILDTLLSRTAWRKQLLHALEQHQVDLADIDLVRRQNLLEDKDESIRELATRLLATSTNQDRLQIIEQYSAALSLQGDALQGKTVFRERCSSCHRLQETGNALGPDLLPYAGKPAQALMNAVLDPNQAIDPRYHNYVVVLDDGRMLSGLIADETATSLTLVSGEGKRQVVLRVDVEELRNTGKSLMPEGLEKDISQENMADLLAYVASLRSPPKTLPGNQPELIQPTDEGALKLLATRAEIHGGEITFEPQFQNIGYWGGARDYVRWKIQVPVDTKYDVWLDWACAADSAGNVYRLEIDGVVLTGTVESTEDWSKFQQVKIGVVQLAAGRHEAVMRPNGQMSKRALLDLRGIHMVPGGQFPAF